MRRIGFVLLALGGIAAAAGDARACSCATTPLSEKVDVADVVAVVRIESTRLRTNASELLKEEEERDGDEVWPVQADFTVLEAIKGKIDDVSSLATGFGNGDCGVSLIPGFDYLLVGTPQGGELVITYCSGSEVLGPQSVFASIDDMKRHPGSHAIVDAMRRQVEAGEPVNDCFDSNPRRFFSAEVKAACQTYLQELDDAYERERVGDDG